MILFGPDGKESGRRFGFIPPDDFVECWQESPTGRSSRLTEPRDATSRRVAPASRRSRRIPDVFRRTCRQELRNVTLAFADLDLPEPVRRGIEDAGFTWCTPIQAETLPTAITGRDIAGQAQTGTGKTAAFLIAAFTLLLNKPRRHQGTGSCPRVLIIAPTRELAMQIFEEGKLLGKHTGLTMHAVYGGVDYVKQLDRLAEGVDILIGTPGRLIDYFKQKVFTLKDAEVLIVDEADRMFDMGFVDDLRYLVTKMPPSTERVSFMYSATLSYRVLELAYEYMHDVHRVAIDEEQVTAERVEQLVYHVGVEEKLPVLLNVLLREQPTRALVFVNTRRGVHFVAERLERHGYARRRAGRRRRPEEAHPHAARVQGRQDQHPRRHRRRVAGPAHRGRHATSSTTTCPRIPRTTCTASAAPRGPARPARRFRWPASTTSTRSRPSRSSSACRCRTRSRRPSW